MECFSVLVFHINNTNTLTQVTTHFKLIVTASTISKATLKETRVFLHCSLCISQVAMITALASSQRLITMIANSLECQEISKQTSHAVIFVLLLLNLSQLFSQ
jgi:hypothetical protein